MTAARPLSSKRVLIISYHFPPLTRGGVFRPLKFAKYLPEYGWDPIVLCASPTPDDVQDSALLDQLPESTVVRRVSHLHPRQLERTLLKGWSILWKLHLRRGARQLEPYKLLRWLPPDPYVTWNGPAYRAALELIREHRPSAIFTTSPPHSTQLLGRQIKGATGLPWVADFRDPWTSNPFDHHPHRWLLKLNERWEQSVLAEADRIVSVTDRMTEQFRMRAIREQPEHIVTIHNGFDREDFSFRPSTCTSDGLFRVLYTGSLYGIRTADSFLAAVDRLVISELLPANLLQVEFMGKDGTSAAVMYGDRSWFCHTPEQPHNCAIEATMAATVLLVLVPPQGSYITSSKLFEYLPTGRPILALAPLDSEAAKIVHATGTGIVVAPDDIDGIAKAIYVMFSAWQVGGLQSCPDEHAINTYERRNQAGALARILDGVARQ